MPPARVGQMSGGGAGVRTQSYQDQIADFEGQTIKPVAEIVDKALTKTLLTPAEFAAGMRVFTDTSSIGLGSYEDRANMADQLVARAPILTPNEARRMFFGLPDIEGGDELMQPKGAPGGTMPGDPAGDDDDDGLENLLTSEQRAEYRRRHNGHHRPNQVA